MKRWVGWLLGFGLAVLGSAAAWVFFSGGSGTPSTGLTTPPLATTSSSAGVSATTSPPGSSNTVPQGQGVVFVIDPARSLATYKVDEVLRGNDNRVVGTTNEVAGQFRFDPSNPTDVEFSEIVINARTFTTDSDTRDRVVRGGVVLNSARDEFELIRFQPTDVMGMPGSIEVGGSFEVRVSGNLTIRGTTNAVTFDTSVTWTDSGTIAGTAVAVVSRSDFGIGIPNVATVSFVSDEVTIKLDFVAAAD